MTTTKNTPFGDAPASPHLTSRDQPPDNNAALLESPNYVGSFPRHASSPTTVSQPHVEKIASPYHRLLAMGVSNSAVLHRMRRDGVGENEEVLQAVFGKKIIDCVNEQEEELPPSSHVMVPQVSVPRHSSQAQPLIEYWKSHKDDKHKDNLELIDFHRAKEIDLALRSFGDMTFNELAEAIDCLAPMDSNRVLILDKLVPTEKERISLLAFHGGDEYLAPSSLWLRRSLTIPEVEAKVKVIQIMATFNDKVDHLRKQFMLVERASDQMLGSPKLKHLLRFVLRIAPTLKKNAGVLNEVCELQHADRTEQPIAAHENDGRMTLLDFVVGCVVSRERHALSLMSDLSECEEASRIDMAELLHEMSELSHALETCKLQLKKMKRDEIVTAHWFETEVSLHEGLTRLEHFVGDGCVRCSRLEFDRDMALASCQSLAEFCNVETRENSTACLALLTKFAQDLDRASQAYFEREYGVWKITKVCSGEDSAALTDSETAIDDRHLRHVRSMVEMYDELPIHKNVDPEAQQARQLTTLVIAVGPILEERSEFVIEKPLHRVKSLVRLYNTLLAEKDVAGPTEKFIQGVLKTRATQDAVPKPTLQNGTPVACKSVTMPNREPLIDCRSLRHVKSVVGAGGELLISPKTEPSGIE